MELRNGTELQGGRYRITRFINSGGFGCTYEAHYSQMNSRVAIKEFFVKDYCNRDEATSRVSVPTTGNRELIAKLKKKFIEEAQAIYEMRHANIVRVIDKFEENGTAYYVMDYIDGKSLAGIVNERGPLSETEALKYIRQVSDALKYVHSLDRLHLDIKPGNIMVDCNGNAILIDFGASKHYDSETGENTSTLLGVNTPGYAPAEQIDRSFTQFNPATDIYALGATFYKLLTGITPPSSVSLMLRKAKLAPLPENISANTRNAIAAAMKPSDEDRPQTIADFLDLLDGKKPGPEIVVIDDVGENTILDDKKEIKQAPGPKAPINPKPQPKPSPTPTPSPRPNNKLGLVLGIIGGLVLAVALFFAIQWGWGESPVDPKPDSIAAAAASDTAGRDTSLILPPDIIDNIKEDKEEKPAVAEETTKPEIKQEERIEEIIARDHKIGSKTETKSDTVEPKPEISVIAPSPEQEVVQVSTPTPAPAPVAKPTSGFINGHAWVDLGLPSGLKWATCNVGASSPSDYGDYYAWGETKTKRKYKEGNSETMWKKGIGDIGGTIRDVVRQKWGYPWRMPSKTEFNELFDNCDWTWTTQGGKNGYKVTSKSNGNCIFLPAAGRMDSKLYKSNSTGFYWCSTSAGDANDVAYEINFGDSYHCISYWMRFYGHSVRPVSE